MSKVGVLRCIVYTWGVYVCMCGCVEIVVCQFFFNILPKNNHILIVTHAIRRSTTVFIHSRFAFASFFFVVCLFVCFCTILVSSLLPHYY